MNFSDIMALAKNGYKPGDIKELLAIQTEPEQKQSEPEQKQSESEQKQSESEQSEENNLLKQVEELQKQLLDTQSKLKQAQKANTQVNIKPEGGQPDAERLNDWARSFM